MNAPLPISTFALEGTDGEWRYQDRQAQRFGLVSPALPPMHPLDAQTRLKQAYDASWEPFGPSSDEYRREVQAIHAAVAAYQAMRGRKGTKAELRNLLLERDGGNCWLCEHPLENDCTLEHKTPLSRGGTWAFNNLALAHRACNGLLGDAPLHVKKAARQAQLNSEWEL